MRAEQAVQLVVEEYGRAVKEHKPFNSAHEGYAVLKEEVDQLWGCIKGNVADQLTREEAAQVGAMALRSLIDPCNAEKDR
ncbi:MAG: hypothetical protein JRD89_20305 [Deltaproteobacteria bacterium]|nr:hypothetical protein [Deltaproteobacteria bacterium]